VGSLKGYGLKTGTLKMVLLKKGIKNTIGRKFEQILE